jgi:predicted PolB exonuclease-like 3'-5' exonuclease
MIDVALDIETIPSGISEELEQVLFKSIEPKPVSAPKNWKDPAKIQKYVEDGQLAAAEDAEKQKAEIRDQYALSPMTGRVACICLYGFKNHKEEIVHRIINKDEEKLLRDFWTTCSQLSNNAQGVLRFVTFNGKSFDIWFLRVRSAMYGIKPSISIDSRRFYSEKHFDVREILTNFGQVKRGKLNEWAVAFGLGQKIAEGSQVKDMWDRGEFDQISDYCLDDCVKTYNLFAPLSLQF